MDAKAVNKKIKEDDAKMNGNDADNMTDREKSRRWWLINVIYVEGFCRGVVFSGRISMMALYLSERFGFAPLEVGFAMMYFAFTMVFYNLYLVRVIQRRVGSEYTILFGCIVDACCMFLFIQPWLDDATAWLNDKIFSPADAAVNASLYSYQYE